METKILKSKWHNQAWEKYSVRVLPIGELWASVPQANKIRGKEFYVPLRDDIAKNGLHFPLLCVHASHGDLKIQKRRFGDKMEPLPFWSTDSDDLKIFAIWGGSQRLRVAKELGYTHVDCAMIPSLDEARGLQKLMRKPYNHLYK